MLPEKILKSDVLDILFENRNKEYGAYTLRREYDKQLIKAIVITFSIAALLLLLSFSFKTEKKPGPKPVIVEAGPLQPPPKEAREKIKPPKTGSSAFQKRSVQPVASVPLPTKPIVVADDKADKNITKIEDVKDKNISDVKSDGGKNSGEQNVAFARDGGNGGESDAGGSKEIDPSVPINNPDVYPEFPGGAAAFKKYLERNLHKPDDAEDGKTADVKVRFVVNPDGSISGFNIIQSGGDEFDREVLRVLKKMPSWKPGKSNGHDVSVYFVVPVKFVYDDQ